MTAKLKLRRVQVLLLEEDHRRLKALYPKGGYGRVIRKLVNDHIRAKLGELTEDLEETTNGSNAG